tara:strand:+ start:4855 stop:4992 length:138 start_codon:yes stop_codon:yes gene_type:complete
MEEEEKSLIHELAMAEFDLARTKEWIKEIKQKIKEKEEEQHAKSA